MSKTAIGGALAALILLPLAIPLLFMGGGETGALPDLVPEEYAEVVTRAGSICPTVTPEIIAAQITQESGWDAGAQSPVGAQWISQFMPGTWGESGLDGDGDGDGDGTADVWNPIDAIWSQGNYMCNLAGQVDKAISQGSILGDPLDLTLAAYNAGFGNVKKYGGIPPFIETENYVRIIRENAANANTGGNIGPPSGAVGVY
ncbi:lytic transglycosylase domain-containing protein [Jonesiaceae bacterium BS-20]|uniref:Lytic transglycosylase domain-containing protein n=1 Tax=Jonesiaceae bacterium BS-20 TaxID=3120821 RepID=A0AAU7DWR3_9MICO